MNREQFKKLTGSIDDILKGLELPVEFDPEGATPGCDYHFVTKDMKSPPEDILKFDSKSSAHLTDVVTALHKQYKGRVGSDVIKSAIVLQFRRACKSAGWTVPKLTQINIEGLATELEAAAHAAQSRCLVFLPVEGLELKQPACDLIGCTLLKPTHLNIQTVVQAKLVPEFEVPDWLQVPLDNDHAVLELYRAKSLLAVLVKGTGKAVLETAVAKARTLLSVAGLVLHHGRYWDFRPHLLFDQNAVPTAHLVVLEDGRVGSGSGDGSRVACAGGLRHPISSAIVQAHIKQDWAKSCVEIMESWSTDTAKGFASQLSTMWGWLGRSYMAQSASEELLFAIIALEVGVGLVKEEKIRKPLAMATAHLLGGNPEEREAIMTRVLRWYDRRSALVHAGAESAGSPDGTLAIDTVLSVAKALTSKRDNWATSEDFRKYIDRLMLGFDSK